MKDCLFCKIIAGEVPAEKVYEDEHVLAFLDINPINRGHTLVIPKNHARNLLHTDDKDLGHLVEAIKKIGNAVKDTVNADGINVHFNNEPAGGQVIFHTHAHVIPRFEDDGLKMWPGEPYPEGKDKETAEKIRSKI